MDIKTSLVNYISILIGFAGVVYYYFHRDKSKRCSFFKILKLFYIIWDLFISFLIIGSSFVLINIAIWSVGSTIINLESETKQSSYIHFGNSDGYLIDLEPGHLYLLNSMDRKIVVYSLPHNNGLRKDFAILSPGMITKIHQGPQYYFKDHPSFNSQNKVLVNVVDYWDH